MRKRATAAEQPKQVCHACGVLYGTEFRDGYYIYWTDKCGVCGKTTSVTEPRDFGYLNNDWKKHVRA